MKLLDWMHRKFRQNNSDPLKDCVIGHACNCLIGQPSLDDQHYYPKSNYGARSYKQVHKDHLRKSFASLEAARIEEEEEEYEEESSAAISELFHGFLAIGTLGSEPVSTDPSTPTFALSFDNITEKDTEVTENELKLINDELEKVLRAEAREDWCNDSSGRNSYVSAGRSSHGSTITLSGKPMEGQETNGTAVCPLQGYLFGSAVEFSETTAAGKKENRTSLGELFQKTKVAEENCGGKYERDEKRMEKEADKSAVNVMKKMLKKKLLHASSRNSAAGDGTVDSTSAEKKMHKILQMFNRKVHPESSTSAHKADKPSKNENKKNNNSGGHINGNQMLADEEFIELPQRTLSKRSTRRHKSQSNPPQSNFSSSDSNGGKECWIKTDADYLVLEL
ncbi:protein LAZY 1-like [Mercurialis annua]|uniref:protein LAZY 1-like n=1 Tax=Mercurialis annua TaxID=3986 RepID=UPI00215DFD3F|nr:protein LAZY 1-like [Mercurialis annua]